mmetsp:Transcript_56261/g.150344  ORF Transcript_56261/g.150344 Transcript_56261/m.150344 type:complete len:233 (+) Transcript_56261:1438-2136(+)
MPLPSLSIPWPGLREQSTASPVGDPTEAVPTTHDNARPRTSLNLGAHAGSQTTAPEARWSPPAGQRTHEQRLQGTAAPRARPQEEAVHVLEALSATSKHVPRCQLSAPGHDFVKKPDETSVVPAHRRDQVAQWNSPRRRCPDTASPSFASAQANVAAPPQLERASTISSRRTPASLPSQKLTGWTAEFRREHPPTAAFSRQCPGHVPAQIARDLSRANGRPAKHRSTKASLQ